MAKKSGPISAFTHTTKNYNKIQKCWTKSS